MKDAFVIGGLIAVVLYLTRPQAGVALVQAMPTQRPAVDPFSGSPIAPPALTNVAPFAISVPAPSTHGGGGPVYGGGGGGGLEPGPFTGPPKQYEWFPDVDPPGWYLDLIGY